ncbi:MULTISPECIES: hypothetical protein [Corynebacterium]|uniref:hypothetical protein n=1 Tax=Corynebacterium TaxID=1716 RepID=UPI00124EA29D|nr:MULTISPECIES: hypothetical protein [Corynebacterium]
MRDLRVMTMDELYQLRSSIDTELRRREAQPFIDEGRQELVDELWAAHPDLRPEYATSWADTGTGAPAWVKPRSAPQGYPVGAVVSHNGRDWVSQHGLNTTEPGTGDSWVERVEHHDDGPPPPPPADGPAPVDDPYILPETSPDNPA